MKKKIKTKKKKSAGELTKPRIIILYMISVFYFMILFFN